MKNQLILFYLLMIAVAGKSQSYTFDWVGKTKLKDIIYPERNAPEVHVLIVPKR